MNAEVRKIQKEVVKRYEEIHDGMRVIKNPELGLAETAAELHVALCIAFNRCPPGIPQLLDILRFRREVRVEGELSLDGKPLN